MNDWHQLPSQNGYLEIFEADRMIFVTFNENTSWMFSLEAPHHGHFI